MTKLYLAHDVKDGVESLFMVKGNRMCVSTYFGYNDSWLDKSKMVFEHWCDEDLDWLRMLNKKLIWEK
ncbi:MAG: hypothetical protein CMF22_10440 [Idiomarinaceae bacterium]|nr:hypothetical protein [Idiomarinaceae bacterium]MBG23859.1 hypothetical protein [Idiomarinaceae bacterium]